jgi:hypothetical protein
MVSESSLCESVRAARSAQSRRGHHAYVPFRSSRTRGFGLQRRDISFVGVVGNRSFKATAGSAFAAAPSPDGLVHSATCEQQRIRTGSPYGLTTAAPATAHSATGHDVASCSGG